MVSPATIIEVAKKVPWEQLIQKMPLIADAIMDIQGRLSGLNLIKSDKKVTVEEFRSTIDQMQGIMEEQTRVIQELTAYNEALIEKVRKLSVQLNFALACSIIAMCLAVFLVIR